MAVTGAALRLPGGELAVAADAHARARGEVPDVAVGGGGEVPVVVADLVAAFAQVEAAALAVERRPQLLDGVGRVGRGRVGVAVVADLGVHVEVVEQHELARDRVGVRRHVLAEKRQVRVAVALGHVAEHLVVGAVLADHVEDVLDRRRLADAPRDRGALGRAGRRVAATVVVGADLEDPRGGFASAAGSGPLHERERAVQEVRDVARRLARRVRLGAARVGDGREALAGEDEHVLAGRVEGDARRVPARRDEAQEAALAGMRDVDGRDGVVVGVRDQRASRRRARARARSASSRGAPSGRARCRSAPRPCGPEGRSPRRRWCWRRRRRACGRPSRTASRSGARRRPPPRAVPGPWRRARPRARRPTPTRRATGRPVPARPCRPRPAGRGARGPHRTRGRRRPRPCRRPARRTARARRPTPRGRP